MAVEQCGTCQETSCDAKQKQAHENEQEFLERQELLARLCKIKHKILVLSGKGGVGKSTVSVNIATALALAGKKVGLLDVDIHGPSIPKLLHVEGSEIHGTQNSLDPITISMGDGSIHVMSVGFLLREKDDAVIWRGPKKYGLIKQFLKDVAWGELDYLVVDSPPGTGDEPLAVVQLIGNADGAIVVTTPQDVAVQDVRRCLVFCNQLQLPVIGVVENMAGFTCPNCGDHHDIFGSQGGKDMAKDMKVPYLCSIPIELEVVKSGDQGMPIVFSYPHSLTAQAFGKITHCLLEDELKQGTQHQKGISVMHRIAIPVTQGLLSSHFGHCEQFIIFDIDPNSNSISSKKELTPPPHEPGTFPKWLHEQGATMIIAGGMGSRAQSLFQQNDIEVVVGAENLPPDVIIEHYLQGQLLSGVNSCDH